MFTLIKYPHTSIFVCNMKTPELIMLKIYMAYRICGVYYNNIIFRNN